MSFGVYCSGFSTLSTRTEEIIGFSGEETIVFLALIKKRSLEKSLLLDFILFLTVKENYLNNNNKRKELSFCHKL